MTKRRDATRARILHAAYALLYRQGFARTSVDAMAAAAHVTKRTLYQHFDSKDAVVEAVLDAQRTHALAQIQEWGGEETQDTRHFVESLFGQLAKWAARRPYLGSGFTRLTMELADLPGHPARKAAHRHKHEVETWIRQRLQATGAPTPDELARQIVILLEGAIALALIHGDATYARTAGKAALELVPASPRQRSVRRATS